MGIIVEINIIIFCFGAAAAYLVAIGDILEPLMGLGTFPAWVDRNVMLCGFWLVVMFPLSMVEKVCAGLATPLSARAVAICASYGSPSSFSYPVPSCCYPGEFSDVHFALRSTRHFVPLLRHFLPFDQHCSV